MIKHFWVWAYDYSGWKSLTFSLQEKILSCYVEQRSHIWVIYDWFYYFLKLWMVWSLTREKTHVFANEVLDLYRLGYVLGCQTDDLLRIPFIRVYIQGKTGGKRSKKCKKKHIMWKIHYLSLGGRIRINSEVFNLNTSYCDEKPP